MLYDDVYSYGFVGALVLFTFTFVYSRLKVADIGLFLAFLAVYTFFDLKTYYYYNANYYCLSFSLSSELSLS